ncbi:hypothetical protein ACFQZ4_20550 [Catellatospora coxensis]
MTERSEHDDYVDGDVDEGATLGDLLGGFSRPEGPVAARPPRPKATRWLSLLGFAIAWTAAGWLTLQVFSLTMPLPLVFAVALTVVGVWRMARSSRPRYRPGARAGPSPTTSPRSPTACGWRWPAGRPSWSGATPTPPASSAGCSRAWPRWSTSGCASATA